MRTGAFALAILLLVTGCLQQAATPPPSREGQVPRADLGGLLGGLRPDLAQDARAEFLRTYHNYVRLAGDHDELQPASGTGSDFFAPGHPVALTTIEALDTLYVMGLDEELQQGVEIAAGVNFDIDADFPFLETTIRLVGGLLSGYHATGDGRLLAQARDLSNRLMPAFDKSPTGMPYRFVNLHTGAVFGRVNFVADIGSGFPEFGDLSRLTGDAQYVAAAKGALQAVFDRRSPAGLLGTALDVETGFWAQPMVSTINPPVDSYFEALWDGWDLLGDADLLAWYEVLTTSLVAHQSVALPEAGLAVGLPGARAHVWFAAAEAATGTPVSYVQFEMGSFYAGLLAQSGRADLGRAYHDSWAALLDRGTYRVLPECVDPLTFEAVCHANFLRPEYVDAALNLWLATGDPVFVERAAASYQHMKETSRAAHGYTILLDVTARPELQGDNTPAYWYSENMKYYWLLFSHPARFDYAHAHLTTEGNVLRGLLRDDGRAAPWSLT